MITEMQEFVAVKTAAVAGQVQRMMLQPVTTAREVAVGSATNLKALKAPVRVVARSGIKLTSMSQSTLQSLIELQSEAVQSAIGDAALRLERASRAANIVDLVRAQIELLPATRERIVEDARRAVKIFRNTGRDLGTLATHTYERVIETTEDEAPAKAVKSVQRTVRRKTASARKATNKVARKVARRTAA